MDRALQPASDKINFKICTICRKSMDTYSSYKTCQLCRAKDKARRDKYQEKLRLELMQPMRIQGFQTNTDLIRKYDATGSSIKGRQENFPTHLDGNRNPSGSVKRMAQKPLSELEGEERQAALKKAKTSLMDIVHQRQGTSTSLSTKPLPTTNLKSAENGHEYINASSLYDALKSKALSSYPVNNNAKLLQFHGSHSIVAASSINNIKRINIVVNDLRKIARLSFGTDAISSLSPSESMTFSFPCNCVGHMQSDRAGSQMQWARLHAKVASTSKQAVSRLCGGKVNVTVLDDNTHALNILGQRIIVRVDHSKV